MENTTQAAEAAPSTLKKKPLSFLGGSLIRKAAFALQIMILLVVCAGGVSLWFARSIGDSVKRMQSASKQSLRISETQNRWLAISSTLDSLSVTKSMPNTLQTLNQQITQLEIDLSALGKARIGLSPEKIAENQKIVQNIQQSETELSDLINKLVPLVEKGRWGTALQLRQSTIATIQSRLVTDIGRLNTNMQSEIAAQTARIITMQVFAQWLSFALVVVGVCFAIFAIWFTRRTIQTPLNQLVSAMEMIAAAESPAELKPIQAYERQDEVGKLSQALMKLTSWLQESYRNLEEQVAERTAHLAQRTRQMEISAQVARDIVDSRDPEALLYKAVNTIRDRFNFYHAGIFLVDQRRDYAVLRSATGQAGREMLERNHRLKIGQTGLVGYVADSGKSRIASDVGQDTVHYKNPSLPETRAEAALPLSVSGEVIGVLDVQSQNEGAFDDETIAILQIVADQLAVAIQNARLFEESQQSLRELEAAYQQANQQAWEHLAKSTSLVGYEFDGNKLHPIYTIEPHSDPNSGPKNDTEAVHIPLKVRGYEVGRIDVWPEEGQLSPEDASLLSNISDRLSQTLESARLYDETRRRAARERITAEIVTKIRATNDPQWIFNTAVSELRKVLVEPSPPGGNGKPVTSQPADEMNGDE
jgi:GAF domain-containing protein